MTKQLSFASTPPAAATAAAAAASPPPMSGAGKCERCDSAKCTAVRPRAFSEDRPRSFYQRPLPANLVDLTSTEGKARFASAFAAGTAEAFFPLVSQYQTQAHPALCGLTTLTIVLNALGIDPARVWMHPWRWFAESLLDCCLDLDSAKLAGVTMEQLRQTGECNGANVDVLRGLEYADARNLLLNAVRSTDHFLAVSYARRALGQTGDGHYSPVAAFDEATDSVLILDTARFKYGPYWVAFKELHAATQPLDPATKKPRGYLVFKIASEAKRACADPHQT